jgi:hypothetical protein
MHVFLKLPFQTVFPFAVHTVVSDHLLFTEVLIFWHSFVCSKNKPDFARVSDTDLVFFLNFIDFGNTEIELSAGYQIQLWALAVARKVKTLSTPKA